MSYNIVLRLLASCCHSRYPVRDPVLQVGGGYVQDTSSAASIFPLSLAAPDGTSFRPAWASVVTTTAHDYDSRNEISGLGHL